MRTKQAKPTDVAIGWMNGTKQRLSSVQKFIKEQYGVDKDRWYEIRFEFACRYAEHITDGNYHPLIANENYMNAFHFQWLKHDVFLHDNNVEGKYPTLKHKMLCSKEFQQFILSYVNTQTK